MSAQTTPATISFPLSGLKPLYRSSRGKKLVVEVDVGSMKKVNDPSTIDDMVAEARLEYYAGKTKGFKNTNKLIDYLES
ncbi:hypothetical protein A3D03_05025 [Candidatus Gottesmanbacteria bacterium RIFCSPHIGHO2_02_FULL_40_13]|uniref:Uncharacterized protein n=1 Tax=Candidatus Gottesmanbacteria bacterium RIFCSPHIGHO2_02_FULL_40_13 TaxID=1798384 RepID=A0A1F6AC85_9BACT|nr:MAG: hypothetical protein A3D03_05025 [Candidatus Gottesmanbacteria bacterium RIFCSPHIGHO2_02_FULL_40_13]